MSSNYAGNDFASVNAIIEEAQNATIEVSYGEGAVTCQMPAILPQVDSETDEWGTRYDYRTEDGDRIAYCLGNAVIGGSDSCFYDGTTVTCDGIDYTAYFEGDDKPEDACGNGLVCIIG